MGHLAHDPVCSMMMLHLKCLLLGGSSRVRIVRNQVSSMVRLCIACWHINKPFHFNSPFLSLGIIPLRSHRQAHTGRLRLLVPFSLRPQGDCLAHMSSRLYLTLEGELISGGVTCSHSPVFLQFSRWQRHRRQPVHTVCRGEFCCLAFLFIYFF